MLYVFLIMEGPLLNHIHLLLGCGDVSDVSLSGGFAPETDCTMPCSGNPTYLCGGGSRLQVRPDLAYEGTTTIYSRVYSTILGREA